MYKCIKGAEGIEVIDNDNKQLIYELSYIETVLLAYDATEGLVSAFIKGHLTRDSGLA